MNFLIDTSVISETRKEKPMAGVVKWWQRHSLSAMRLSVVTLHELRYGVEIAPLGAKRAGLERWVEEFVLRAFTGRILPVNIEVVENCARLMGACKTKGYQPEFAYALVAATARTYGLRVATLNRKDFARLGVELVEF